MRDFDCASHLIADGEQPGNIGPPLIGMKFRFPDTKTLRSQIWDATENNPDSRMPPFGRHGILGSALTMKIDYYRMDDEGFFAALRHSLADLRLLPSPTKKD